ncbi:hypothetical protein BLA29_007866 [Euroglyphus maynei]|uniref:GT23 domain-containing protein n=1 Tax=Euroglyphus maynei TaxID=6958 RepID=A0A1Y3B6B0_EURMA|nr:hypothetical protein BLA29_007866 [Euroglyphus maynei]
MDANTSSNNNDNDIDKIKQDNKNKEICKSINKIICDSDKSCGFGCSIHHVAYCLIAALALNRTLVLYPGEMFNSPTHHYRLLFKSINSICHDIRPQDDWMSNAVNINEIINQKSKTNNNSVYHDDDRIEVIYLPIIEDLDKNAKFRPMAIPEQLRTQLEQLTRIPFVVFLVI